MSFKVSQHANLGFIDRDIKDMLDKLCEAHKRTIKAELECLIVDASVHYEIQTSINK